ncbi:MAG: 50S ribosomal protein L18 [Alphaproteobacteria bacterium]
MKTARELFERRKARLRFNLRKKAKGKVRLSVYRSCKHIYAQLIDDLAGKTLASASSVDKELKATIKSGSTKDAATAVGRLVAQRGIKAGVKNIVFDRGGYIFHGRIKALADAAREEGLSF